MYKTLIGKIFNRRALLWLVDTFIILATCLFALVLSKGSVGSLHLEGNFTMLKFVAFFVTVMAWRFFFRLYNNMWRYANSVVFLKLIVADSFAGFTLFLLGYFFYLPLFIGFSYTLLMTLVCLFTTLMSRFIYQFFFTYFGRTKNKSMLKLLFNFNHDINLQKINIAIVGAGKTGVMFAEELLRNPASHYYPYCFIEKDTNIVNREVNGIYVYPENEDIIDVIREMPVQEIVIALPEVTLNTRQRLYAFYKRTGCKIKLYDYPISERGFGQGQGQKRVLRDFNIEDLLFRDILLADTQKARDFYSDKVIVVTGGGGSIGSELCRQIARLSPKKLVILDAYENNAYEIQQELFRHYSAQKTLDLEVIIASVRDEARLDEIFARVKPDIVFHAAAHKHVPLMEDSAVEAVKNNVFGTYNVANMAEKYGVKKFVLISTDKAVNPTSIMGASKRVCEMIIQSRVDSPTSFVAVRFGNVLGSNGSVIPLFMKQLEQGGPITITDKRIVRYFMTIPEAVSLVMEAGALAQKGELFVLDMGYPVKILNMAENMIRLNGLEPYKDVDIVEIGLRPGEKLYEELLIKSEQLDKTDNNKIFIERDTPKPRSEIEDYLVILKQAVITGNNKNIADAFAKIVPTYAR